MENKSFKINNGKLTYKNNALKGVQKEELFTKYDFISILGKGANGITFLVHHRFIQVKQVIKIYSENISYDKAVKEIKKNSIPKLQSISAVNYDGGQIISPFKSCYSIMENIEGFTTLKKWIQNRDYIWDNSDKESADFDSIKEYIFSESLNMLISFLKTIVLKNEVDIVHGDLNDNNILVYNKFEKFKEIKDRPITRSILGFVNQYRETRIGTLTEISNKLIDMGTSQAMGTSKKNGKSREAWFIIENIRRIMKPFFEEKNINYSDLFNFNVEKDRRSLTSKFGQQINYEYLTNDCIRLTLLFNFMLGILYNNKSDTKIDLFENPGREQDARWINIFVSEDYLELLLSGINSPSLVHSLSLVSSKENNDYINWNEVWQYFVKSFPNNGLDNYVFKKKSYGFEIKKKL